MSNPDFEKYSDELAKFTNAASMDLGELAVRIREQIATKKGALFADNALIHAASVLLSRMLSMMCVAASSGGPAKLEEVAAETEGEILELVQTIMAKHIKNGFVIVQKNKPGEKPG